MTDSRCSPSRANRTTYPAHSSQLVVLMVERWKLRIRQVARESHVGTSLLDGQLYST